MTQAEYEALGAHSITAQSIGTTHLADAAITQAQFKTKAVVALADAAATLTGAQMVDSSIFTITPTAPRTLTTDTATNIVAALPRYQVGTWFDITIINLAAFDVTLAAGTGVTLTGRVIVNNASSTWRVRIDSATTVTIYSMALAATGSADISAKVTHSAAQSIANNTVTVLNYDTETFDTDAIHDNDVPNNNRLTCRTAGKYLIISEVVFANDGTGRRELWIQDQSSNQFGKILVPAAAGDVMGLVTTVLLNMTVGQWVETRVLQTSGAALNVLASYPARFGMIKVLG